MVTKEQATLALEPPTTNSASIHTEVQTNKQTKILFNINKSVQIKGCCSCSIMHFVDKQATMKVNNFKTISQQQSL